jgi:hypothetical protein
MMQPVETYRARGIAVLLPAVFVAAWLVAPCAAQTKPEAAVTKAVGTIKAIQSGSIIIAAESGGDVTATLAASTKIFRVPPGEKDLKNATALRPEELQQGDRVLVRGQASADGRTITALAVIVMKRADISAQHQRETEEWQKHGVGGLVTIIDAATGTVTISAGGLGAAHNIAIHTSNNTVLRRYAPGSVKFDDAKAAPLADIRAGDQLRARGTRSADGNELAADEVVSGSFRNIAGTVTATDLASNTITVHDLIAKAPVVVKVSSESQMKKLPPEMAQRLAIRLKGRAGGDQSGNSQAAGSQPPVRSGSDSQAAPPGNGQQRPGEVSQSANGRNGDVQRMLGHLPNCSLADLAKGETVMIVSTPGDAGQVTAITLLAGVEPILTAAPTRSASLLSPWSLNTGGGEGDSAP